MTYEEAAHVDDAIDEALSQLSRLEADVAALADRLDDDRARLQPLPMASSPPTLSVAQLREQIRETRRLNEESRARARAHMAALKQLASRSRPRP